MQKELIKPIKNIISNYSFEDAEAIINVMFKPKKFTLPKRFPDLSRYKTIGVDVETCDPNLLEFGCGAPRGDGFIVGVSISTETGKAWYFPVRHKAGENMDPEKVFAWLNDALGNPDQEKVGANLLYDIAWLATEGVEVKGPLHDIQIAETLIDENRNSFKLESLGQLYEGKGKDETLLEAMSKVYGHKDLKGEMWKLPAKYVAQYAKIDAILPQKIWLKQKVELTRQALWKVYLEIEQPLLRILAKMQFQGVRVDLEKAEKHKKIIEAEYDKHKQALTKMVGFDVNENSPDELGKAFDKLGIKYNRTAKSKQPQVKQDWLEQLKHPIAEHILGCRKNLKLKNDFLNKILRGSVGDRLYCTFKQNKQDKGGTRSGRFSCSNPNLQQIPSRGDNAYLIRELFIPDEGKVWGKKDYSQQEPKLGLHYALVLKLPGAKEFLEKFLSLDKPDFYIAARDLVNQFYELKGDPKAQRKLMKEPVLGNMYGLGIDTLCARMHLSLDEGMEVLNAVNKAFPFARELYRYGKEAAETRHQIRTIGGRLRHFNLFEPIGNKFQTVQENGDPWPAYYEDKARQVYGDRITRAFVYKAINSLIQGSAADMGKKALILLYEETGYLPNLLVHDEFDGNYSLDELDQIHVHAKIMEEAVPTLCPMSVDPEIGDNWYNVMSIDNYLNNKGKAA